MDGSRYISNPFSCHYFFIFPPFDKNLEGLRFSDKMAGTVSCQTS